MINQICPWDRFQPGVLNFCEEKLCSWVVKPAETWSNISFVIVGLLVIYLSKKENQRHLTPIGYIGIILGIFSAFFHASGTFIGSWLDISSMLLFSGIGITYNLIRYFKLERTKVIPIFLTITIPSMALIYIIEGSGIFMFGLQFTSALGIEFLIYKRSAVKADYKHLKGMLVVVGIAWSVWWLDITKTVCNPHNHYFNGHAFWHLLVGTTFYFIYRFYTQFTELKN